MKKGQTTTEFQLTLLTCVLGVLVAFGVLTPADITNFVATIQTISGSLITAFAAIGYSVSRGLAKKNSSK